MPAAIPVELIHKSFVSQNQAKTHYCDILHTYQPGQTVGKQHKADLCSLLKSHPHYGRLDSDVITDIKVTQGRFGRNCFAFDTAKATQQKFSLIRCINEASVPRVDAPDTTLTPGASDSRPASKALEASGASVAPVGSTSTVAPVPSPQSAAEHRKKKSNTPAEDAQAPSAVVVEPGKEA